MAWLGCVPPTHGAVQATASESHGLREAEGQEAAFHQQRYASKAESARVFSCRCLRLGFHISVS